MISKELLSEVLGFDAEVDGLTPSGMIVYKQKSIEYRGVFYER